MAEKSSKFSDLLVFMEQSTLKKVHPLNSVCRLCGDTVESRHLPRVDSKYVWNLIIESESLAFNADIQEVRRTCVLLVSKASEFRFCQIKSNYANAARTKVLSEAFC